MVESSALLKRRGPKGLRGFESPPHREIDAVDSIIHPGDENPSFERRSRHSSKRRRGRAGVRLRKAQPEGQGLGRGRSQSPLTENAPQPHQISSRGMRISFDHPRDSAPPREQREPHPWSLAPRGNPPLTGSSGFEFKNKGRHRSASPAKSVVGPSLRRRPSSLIHCDIWYYSFDKNAEAA